MAKLSTPERTATANRISAIQAGHKAPPSDECLPTLEKSLKMLWRIAQAAEHKAPANAISAIHLIAEIEGYKKQRSDSGHSSITPEALTAAIASARPINFIEQQHVTVHQGK